MNPPGDADTDGSPSNCTAFFISAVHDLSLYETHAPRSTPPHTRDSLFPYPSISCNAFISPCPTVIFFPFYSPLLSYLVQLSPLFVPLYLCFYPCLDICLSVSLFCCSEPHPPPLLFVSLPLLVLSIVQMCPWSVVAWLGDNRSDFETGGWQPCCH